MLRISTANIQQFKNTNGNFQKPFFKFFFLMLLWHIQRSQSCHQQNNSSSFWSFNIENWYMCIISVICIIFRLCMTYFKNVRSWLRRVFDFKKLTNMIYWTSGRYQFFQFSQSASKSYKWWNDFILWKNPSNGLSFRFLKSSFNKSRTFGKRRTIIYAIQQILVILGVSVDISKAFDKINHETPPKNLKFIVCWGYLLKEYLVSPPESCYKQ